MAVALHTYAFGDDGEPIAEFVTYGEDEAEAQERHDALLARCELLQAQETDLEAETEEIDAEDIPNAADFEDEEDEEAEEG